MVRHDHQHGYDAEQLNIRVPYPPVHFLVTIGFYVHMLFLLIFILLLMAR